MATVIIMQGIPGSGKTTVVNKLLGDGVDRYQLVCRDDFRFALGVRYGEMNYSLEPIITSITHTMIRAFLQRGLNIIIDETNTTIKNIQDIKRISDEYEADIYIYRMVTPLNICIKRRCADGKFPRHVIERMASNMEKMDIDLPIVEIEGY